MLIRTLCFLWLGLGSAWLGSASAQQRGDQQIRTMGPPSVLPQSVLPQSTLTPSVLPRTVMPEAALAKTGIPDTNPYVAKTIEAQVRARREAGQPVPRREQPVVVPR